MKHPFPKYNKKLEAPYWAFQTYLISQVEMNIQAMISANFTKWSKSFYKIMLDEQICEYLIDEKAFGDYIFE